MPTTRPTWARHFFYRSTHTRTTWKLRIGLVVLVPVVGWLTSGIWSVAVADSLICHGDVARSDAILVENFDPSYLSFERARQLRTAGYADTVLVPIPHDIGKPDPGVVESTTTAMLAGLARLGDFNVVPIREVEPISLNAARDILRFLKERKIHSVIVVSPLFRSKRSELVYQAILGNAGITVRCEPVRGPRRPSSWMQSGHGVQDVVEQFVKLQYYRFFVLPLAS
jgi:hypothetical protein